MDSGTSADRATSRNSIPAVFVGAPVGMALLIVVGLGLAGPSGEFAGDAFRTASRTWLTRNAIFNTLISSLLATVVASALAWLMVPALHYPGRARWLTGLLVGGILLTPGSLAVLVWRESWMSGLWLTDARGAIVAAGLVLGWRLAPVCILLVWWMGAGRSKRTWLRSVILCGWLASIDLPVAYLLTQGEPFNAAHTAVSWAWQQAWVAGQWNLAAVLMLGLSVWTVTAWWMQKLLSTRSAGRGSGDKSQLGSPLSPRFAAVFAGLVLPLPVWLGLVQVDWGTVGATLTFILQTGAGRWTANSLLVMLVAGSVAWGLRRLIGESWDLGWRRVFMLGGMLGVVTGWFVVVWLLATMVTADDRLATPAGMLTLALFCGWCGALLAAGIVPARGRFWLIDSAGVAAGVAAVLAAVLVQQELAVGLVLALDGPEMTGLLGSKSVVQLGRVPAYPHAVYWLLVCSFGFFTLVCAAATILGRFVFPPLRSQDK